MDDALESIASATDISIPSSFSMALASTSFINPVSSGVPRVCSQSHLVMGHASEFGDSDCGESLEAHHTHLDFTPSEDDNDFVQRKCCAFWKYIHSRHELQDLMVKPEVPSVKVCDRDSSDNAGSFSKPPSAEHVEKKPTTAVSMLQIVEEKGLIDKAFEAKMQQSRCTLGSHEYEFGKKSEKPKCRCPGPCSMCPNALAQHKVSDAKSLCEELEAWDKKHPKSMEPPSHPPPLSHSVMQRRVKTNLILPIL